jgi:hypothetical protein
MNAINEYEIHPKAALDDIIIRIKNIDECMAALNGENFAGVSHAELLSCRDALIQLGEDIRIIFLGKELECAE